MKSQHVVYTRSKVNSALRRAVAACMAVCVVCVSAASSARAQEIAPNDPAYPTQSYLRQTNTPDAWHITTGSRRVVVALIDSGVESVHPDLEANIWTNPSADIVSVDGGNGIAGDIHGWDFIGHGPNPGPDLTTAHSNIGLHHGTIVAGIIGAAGDNGTAGAGINWQVSIMPLRALNGEGDSGDGAPIGVIDAINYAIDHHADVINMSFVGQEADPELVHAIRRAYEAGITVVAAAGNEGNGGNVNGNLDISPRYPVCIDGPMGEPWWVIGVAAVDGTNRKAPFSGYGKKCVDISAPGVGISSTLVFVPTTPGLNQLYGGDFAGTSLAAPQVTGAIALMKALKPDLTPKQIYEILQHTATPIDSLNPSYTGQLGAGLLNTGAALLAVRAMVPDNTLWIGSTGNPTALQLSAADVVERKFVFNYGRRIGVTLARAHDASTGAPLIVTGTANTSSRIQVFDDAGKPYGKSFLAFPSAYQGGVQIAVGDIDGDGADEIVAVPARRYLPEVRVYSLAGALKARFFAYDAHARFGLSVALADVDANGRPDIITGVREGGAAEIRMFSADGHALNGGFFAAGSTYRGGVNIAAIDVDGDKRAEIFTVPLASGADSTVRMFSTDGILRAHAPLVYEKNVQFAVALGDVLRDGHIEIAVARAGARVGIQMFDARLQALDAGGALPINPKEFNGTPTLVIAP